MKHLKFLLAALLIAALAATPALAIELTAGTGDAFYVQDGANVLSADTEAQIAAYNETLENQCSEAQLVVVTVSYLDEDSDIAATQLMNDWGVGSAKDSNGMLLLLVANEYRGWLAVGDGLDEVFTDDDAERYCEEYFWDYIDRDKFDEGVLSLTGALYDWYLDYYDAEDTASDAPDSAEVNSGTEKTAKKDGPGAGKIILILIILCVIVIPVCRRIRRGRSQG